MYSHFVTRRSMTAFACLLCLFLALSSCSRQTAPPVPKPAVPAPVAAPIVSAPRPAVIRPKALRPIAFPDLDTDEISSLVFSPNGRRLAFGYGTDAEVSMWNLETGNLDWQRDVDAASGGFMQFGPHGRFLVAQFGDPDNVTPIIVCTVGGQLIRNLGSFQGGGNAMLEKSGRFLVIGGSQDRIVNGIMQYNAAQLTEVWNTHTWHRVDHVATAPADFRGFVPLTSSGKIIRHITPKKIAELLAADGEPAANGWKPPAAPVFGNPYSSFESEYTGINNLHYVRLEGNHDNTGQVEVWDLHQRKHLWTDRINNDSPLSAAISPDEQTLAVGTIQGYVYFWNLKTGHFLSKTHCSSDVLRCLAFSPNGRILAAAGGEVSADYSMGDGVRLLDTRSHKLLAVLKVEFPGQYYEEKTWSLNHPYWFASLPDLSYIASDSVVKKIRTPGRARDAKIIRRFNRPRRVRTALQECYRR